MLNNSIFENKTFSEEFLGFSRKANIFVISSIVFIGLIGHLLTICVYSQRRFRQNFNSVYLLVLAINDSLFLIVHYFEDTVRTIKDVYSVDLLNLVDISELACYLFSYLRNVIRFNSAYLIVLFTLQRLLLVYNPMSTQMKSKKSAWTCVCLICLTGFVLNIWALFFFRLDEQKETKYCDIINEIHATYLIVNSIYICFVFFIPIVFIFICNCLVIVKSKKDDIKRIAMNSKSIKETNEMIIIISTPTTYKDTISKNKNRFKSLSLVGKSEKKTSTSSEANHCYSRKITSTLVIISIAYVILNFPYLVSWFIYFIYRSNDETFRNYQFAALQISEIFYVSNYAISFFAYCVSGTMFRNQLKTSFDLNKVTEQNRS